LQLRQLDNPDSSALAMRSTANSVCSISELGARATGDQWFALHHFASFPLIKNSNS